MVNHSFPCHLLPLVRCPDDGAALTPDPRDGGSVVCAACGRRFGFDGAVLQLGMDRLHPESRNEQAIRDEEARSDGGPSWDSAAGAMEIDAMLEALALEPHHRVMELGAGRGRFTHRLVGRCRAVVGIDISLESLRRAERVTGSDVALVQADAADPVGAPAAFDRVLGTLTSNLPDRETRIRSYRTAARALTDDGRFVFSTHYYGVRARLDGEAKLGRYREGGIHRELLTATEVRREATEAFRHVQVRPICVVLPFTVRLGLPLAQIDRAARRLPLLRAFGTLLLGVAESPRR